MRARAFAVEVAQGLLDERLADAAPAAGRRHRHGEDLGFIGGQPVEDEPGRCAPAESVAVVREQRMHAGCTSSASNSASLQPRLKALAWISASAPQSETSARRVETVGAAPRLHARARILSPCGLASAPRRVERDRRAAGLGRRPSARHVGDVGRVGVRGSCDSASAERFGITIGAPEPVRMRGLGASASQAAICRPRTALARNDHFPPIASSLGERVDLAALGVENGHALSRRLRRARIGISQRVQAAYADRRDFERQRQPARRCDPDANAGEGAGPGCHSDAVEISES